MLIRTTPFCSEQAAAEAGWDQLGPAFVVYSEPAPGTVPIYRETPIASVGSKFHFSSRSALDAAALGWQQELAFYAYATPTPAPCRCIARSQRSLLLFDPQSGGSLAAGVNNLGVAFYAYPAMRCGPGRPWRWTRAAWRGLGWARATDRLCA